MAWEQVAQGGPLDTYELGSYESYLDEGQRGLLELDLRLSVSQSVASELESRLRQAGVEDVSVRTASPMLRIQFRKGFPWLAVISAAILGMIALAILIVGWRFFREVVNTVPAPFNWLLVVGVVAIGIMILARRR